MKKWIALCGAVLALGLLADLETFEGITATARAYYAWTDSLTDAPDDGKAFFGRDAMANYCIIGSRQLGAEVTQDVTAQPMMEKQIVFPHVFKHRSQALVEVHQSLAKTFWIAPVTIHSIKID